MLPSDKWALEVARRAVGASGLQAILGGMGILYVVGTPIGNLEDLTYRAARVLGQVSLVAAEDTRVTRRLLNHLGIRVSLTSYNQHNRRAKSPAILEALADGDVALVTDAGMPGISDPGAELVSLAAGAGFAVEVVPAVSAVTTALSVSGFPGDAFVFLGFLPRRSRDRLALLQSVGSSPHTLVIFEAPHRVGFALNDLLVVLGDRDIAVCREMTKLHQEVWRGPLSQAIHHFGEPRGEFTLVVRGASADQVSTGPAAGDLELARQRLARLREDGNPARDAVAIVADSLGIPRNTVYRLWLESVEGRPT